MLTNKEKIFIKVIIRILGFAKSKFEDIFNEDYEKIDEKIAKEIRSKK